VKRAIFEKEYNSDPIEVSASSEVKGERTEDKGERTEETLVFHPPLLDKATKMVRGRITVMFSTIIDVIDIYLQ
jgi:hypothetical protein